MEYVLYETCIRYLLCSFRFARVYGAHADNCFVREGYLEGKCAVFTRSSGARRPPFPDLQVSEHD